MQNRLRAWMFALAAALLANPAALSADNPAGTTATTPQAAAGASPAPADVPVGAPEQPPSSPHIALVLPLDAPAFARVADAVRRGFVTAAAIEGGDTAYRVYATGDDYASAVDAVREAVAKGAVAVVGPLRRGAVSAVAASGAPSVPTLALNLPENESYSTPKNLYFFSLQAEAEARQVARLAFQTGRTRALVIASPASLDRRLQAAFADEWERMGGAVTGVEQPASTDTAGLVRLRQKWPADDQTLVFLAVDAPRARQVRPFLDPALPVFATSQVYPGRDALANHDLNGVHFVDMPWFIEPDHAAVMIYPRPERPLAVDLERFYALGIDAWRLVRTLLTGGDALDGVTGRIRLGPNRQFGREPLAAQFRDGAARPDAPVEQ